MKKSNKPTYKRWHSLMYKYWLNIAYKTQMAVFHTYGVKNDSDGDDTSKQKTSVEENLTVM